jgi:hypothetical protein
VTVSFSKYLPWQAMHLLERSILFSKTCCRPFAASFRGIVEQAILTFHVRFSVSKALSLLKNRSLSHCIVSIGLIDELQGFRIQSRNADAPLRTLRHPKKGSFKTTVILTTVREMRITPLLRYPPPLQLGITITASLCITAAFV